MESLGWGGECKLPIGHMGLSALFTVGNSILMTLKHLSVKVNVYISKSITSILNYCGRLQKHDKLL